jgi:DNA-binding transcriptional LysR family regulator
VRSVAGGFEPELRIGVDAIIDFDALTPLIRDFHRHRAPTRLVFSYEVLDGAWEALLEGRADLIIGAPYDAPDQALASTRFSLRRLGTVDFVFCVAPDHPLAKAEEPLSAHDLLAHRAVVLAGTSRLQASRTAGLLSGQDTLTVATLAQKVAMQIAGLGTGWIPAPIAQTCLENGSLVAREIAEPRPPATLHYAWRRTDPGKALQWWLERLAIAQVQSRLIDYRRASGSPAARSSRRPSR